MGHEFIIHRTTCWACAEAHDEDINAVNNGRMVIDENGALCHILDYNRIQVCPYCGEKAAWAEAPCPNGDSGAAAALFSFEVVRVGDE